MAHSNNNLHSAKREKNDEFYTQLSDIEKELKHYKHHFQDKVVLCNCDDPDWSNFFVYFSKNFVSLGLKKLITTHYSRDGKGHKLVIENKPGNPITMAPVKTELRGAGDFRGDECIEILKEADIVVTNPPFSLFREYMAQLIEYDKKFLIIGNMNALSYKEIFPLIKDNKVWLGYNSVSQFRQKDGSIKKFGNILWYTNLEIDKRHEELVLYKLYDENLYPKYDNYDAIEVSTVKDIPTDYAGVMGVPITFLNTYNPEQFEIIGMAPERASSGKDVLRIKKYVNAIQHNSDGSITGGNKVNDGPTIIFDSIPDKFPYYTSETVLNKYIRVLYSRILIRRKSDEN